MVNELTRVDRLQLPHHFVELDQKTYDALSPAKRAEIDALGGPRAVVVAMDKCLYGHPLAGHVFITGFAEFLRKQGWTEVVGVPGLFEKDSCLLAAYCDDICVAGPRAEVDAFWHTIRFVEDGSERYKLREQGPCEDFLGIRVTQRESAEEFVAEFDMEEYCVEMTRRTSTCLLEPLEGPRRPPRRPHSTIQDRNQHFFQVRSPNPPW